MKLFGFTLLRNGLKYDYPFPESLESLTGLCEQVHLALGDSDDGTEKELHSPKIKIIPTKWDETKRKGGIILSEQTNIALESLESEQQHAWGIYLQADEVIGEFDFEKIRADIAAADQAGCDAVSFRYLHFWQAYDQLAINARWYPQEIRAIKLGYGIRSYGDAQSFTGFKKRFESDATIFHYGHVREASAYERKRWDFGKWWHSTDEELTKVLKKGDRKEKKERTLRYLGPHPKFMQERMGLAIPEKKERVLLFGDQALAPEFEKKISVGKIYRGDALRDLAGFHKEEIVLTSTTSTWAKLVSRGKLETKVPTKMLSPHAREWTPEFQATMRLSEKGYSVL